MEKEIWKPYPKCSDYQVSNFGKVKSIQREVSHKIWKKMLVEERILSTQKSYNGYIKVQMSIDKKKKKYYLHRILAETFISNPDNKPQINHKNGVRDDNRVENLEWCTNSENNKHAFSVLKRVHSRPYFGRMGSLHHSSKKVFCGSLNMEFGSTREASRKLGVSQASVSDVCLGKKSSVNGFYLRYK